MNNGLIPIRDVARQLDIPEPYLEEYGKYTAKLRLELLDHPLRSSPGKLILVTGITPTTAGEGKTVTSIGLAQGLSKLGRKAVATLREPSLGPVFGLKGGATGGGRSKVEPFEKINLHFTGDFHAITSAHNLLAALLDAHLIHGNALRIDVNNVVWPRTMDMNDRALREMVVGLGGRLNGIPRETGFVITAASEIMAILALASSRDDLRRRLSEIVVAFDVDGKPVRAGDLQATGAMMVLLNEAILPNLVQTTENTPAFVHAGPFANIAHGTSSVISQRMALGMAEYAVNECGFASDLGAEKYFDLVMRSSGLKPSTAVLVASVRAIASHGTPEAGLANLGRHIEILQNYNVPIVVSINRFTGDTPAQLDAIRAFAKERGVDAVDTDVFNRGGEGGMALGEAVISASATANLDRIEPIYSCQIPMAEKVRTIARKVYRAADVQFDPAAKKKLDQYAAAGYGALPVCIAKTQYSVSDNPKLLGAPEGFTLTVNDAFLSAGAGFVVVVAGNMMRMPGLGKVPQAVKLDVTPSGEITGMA